MVSQLVGHPFWGGVVEGGAALPPQTEEERMENLVQGTLVWVALQGVEFQAPGWEVEMQQVLYLTCMVCVCVYMYVCNETRHNRVADL